ncbi:MAG: GntR family transcriptional regulator [Erysipelotrichaceae bacterium]
MAKMTSSEYVYQELKKQIMFLQLRPGQQINETETADRFKVSRTPIREAFRRLEMEGLIDIKPQSGTTVSLIDIDEISDILYIREKLELSVLQEIKNLSESQIIKLRVLLLQEKEMIDHDGDLFEMSQKFLELDNRLHEKFFTLANKSSIWKRISQDQPHYNRIRVLTNVYVKSDLYKLYEEHVAIVSALVNQDYQTLTDLYKKHVYGGMESLATIVNENREYFR